MNSLVRGGTPVTHCLRMRLISTKLDILVIFCVTVTFNIPRNRTCTFAVKVVNMASSSESLLDLRFCEAVSYAFRRLEMSHISLKTEQRSSMEAIYKGRDVFVWLPTGYGKSLCNQALPFLIDYKRGLVDTEKSSCVLVISPLVALMVRGLIRSNELHHLNPT